MSVHYTNNKNICDDFVIFLLLISLMSIASHHTLTVCDDVHIGVNSIGSDWYQLKRTVLSMWLPVYISRKH